MHEEIKKNNYVLSKIIGNDSNSFVTSVCIVYHDIIHLTVKSEYPHSTY